MNRFVAFIHTDWLAMMNDNEGNRPRPSEVFTSSIIIRSLRRSNILIFGLVLLRSFLVAVLFISRVHCYPRRKPWLGHFTLTDVVKRPMGIAVIWHVLCKPYSLLGWIYDCNWCPLSLLRASPAAVYNSWRLQRLTLVTFAKTETENTGRVTTTSFPLCYYLH